MTVTRLNINQWAKEDRPREKLLQKGAGALSNAELLAILIGSGNTEESAVELMRRLLTDHKNSLRTLCRLSAAQLMVTEQQSVPGTKQKRTVRRYKGLGEAKAVTLLAAFELSRRRLAETTAERTVIRNSSDMYNYFRPRMQDLGREECYALLLNQSNKVIGDVLIGRGGLTETSVDLRLVLKEALLHDATSVALCHNHPSGNPRPGDADNRLTDRLNHSCRHIGLRLIDHIVLTDGSYYSYADEGQL